MCRPDTSLILFCLSRESSRECFSFHSCRSHFECCLYTKKLKWVSFWPKLKSFLRVGNWKIKFKPLFFLQQLAIVGSSRKAGMWQVEVYLIFHLLWKSLNLLFEKNFPASVLLSVCFNVILLRKSYFSSSTFKNCWEWKKKTFSFRWQSQNFSSAQQRPHKTINFLLPLPLLRWREKILNKQ